MVPLERNVYGHPSAGLLRDNSKKKLMKNADDDEPTSFLDHVYLGCTQRECKPNETIVEQYEKMFDSRIFCWNKRKINGMGKTSRANRSVVLRHGRTCSKMR